MSVSLFLFPTSCETGLWVQVLIQKSLSNGKEQYYHQKTEFYPNPAIISLDLEQMPQLLRTLVYSSVQEAVDVREARVPNPLETKKAPRSEPELFWRSVWF